MDKILELREKRAKAWEADVWLAERAHPLAV